MSMAAATTTVALAVCAAPAQAAEPRVFPAGVACEFPLKVEAAGDPRVAREFQDAEGNVVRSLIAGVGQATTLTNVSTGASITLPANGSVQRTVFHSDGMRTVTLTGHWVLILFPTDVPAGPSTTLHVGRVVFTANKNDDFVVLSTSGRRIDLCAALS